MPAENFALRDPKELHSNTSFITLCVYVLYGLTFHFSLPYYLLYISLFLLAVNFVLIGMLMYRIAQKKAEINLIRNRFFTILRITVNLLLLFMVLNLLEFV
jgi:hypothetical protein